MSTATLRPIRRLCPSTARTSVRARPGPAAARLRSSRPEPARVPAGYVAKILVDEGEEVPTSTVREPQQPGPLCLKARVVVQPVMVVVEEEEDIGAFGVRSPTASALPTLP